MLISIITVNYNDVKGLEKTILSVQNQVYNNFEHIIIENPRVTQPCLHVLAEVDPNKYNHEQNHH
mgnify:CR=1 FL=1